MCVRAGSFLSAFLGVVAAAALLAPERAVSVDERKLSLYHTHTGRRLDVVYARGAEYLDEGLERIEVFLSDFRTGERHEIDPKLLDLLYDLRAALSSRGTYEVISAYRSPQTNEVLRNRGSGVASKSQHMLGKAIDVRLRVFR